MGFLSRLMIFNAIVGLAAALHAQDMAPPLPDWNEAATPLPQEMLTPQADSLPEPPNQPVDLPPAQNLPVLPPLMQPADGEPSPEIPEIPGLDKPQEPAPRAKVVGESEPAAPVLAVQSKWFASPREARAQAVKQGKPMLLVVGGFAWSPPCKAMNNDVLAAPKFKELADKNFVLSFLNVPTRSKPEDERQTKQFEAIRQYRELLHIRSLPTIILFDAAGHEIDRMVGYNFNRSLRVGSYMKLMDRIQRQAEYTAKLRTDQEKRHKMLAETQRYRTWTSTEGTTLFAKVIKFTELPFLDEAEPTVEKTERAVELVDEYGKARTVPVRKLEIGDREIAKRLIEQK